MFCCKAKCCCSNRSSGWCSWWRGRHRRGVNYGIQIAPGSAPPPWQTGFVPWHAWWGPGWTNPSWANRPALPTRQPDHSMWSFPTGNLSWCPKSDYCLPTTRQCQWSLSASPLPQTGDGRPRFAPWVGLNPFQPDMPMVGWDVRQNPVTARLTTGAHISTELTHTLNSPMTDIPVSIVEIAIPTCSMAYLWNAVRVQKTHSISFRDVLDAIYEWLQTPLTQDEMDHIESVSPASVEAVMWAFHDRAAESMSLHGWEHRQGPRRIDCLGDIRRWMGLSYSPTGQGMQLVLNLSTIQR